MVAWKTVKSWKKKKTYVRAEIALQKVEGKWERGITEIRYSRHDHENKAYVPEIRSKGAVRKFLTCPDIKFSSFLSGYTSRYPRGRRFLALDQSSRRTTRIAIRFLAMSASRAFKCPAKLFWTSLVTSGRCRRTRYTCQYVIAVLCYISNRETMLRPLMYFAIYLFTKWGRTRWCCHVFCSVPRLM